MVVGEVDDGHQKEYLGRVVGIGQRYKVRGSAIALEQNLLRFECFLTGNGPAGPGVCLP